MRLHDSVGEFLAVIVAPALRKNQADALALFVASALTLSRSILTDLAVAITRHGWAKTVKAALKRLDRWINNDRVQVGKAMTPVVQKLLAQRKKKLVLSVDWTDLRGFKVLVAAANIKGRAVWLLWHSVPKSGLNLNMNRIEEQLLFDLRQMLPRGLQVILLADRGFHKSRLFRYCQTLHFHYVIRIKPELTVQSRRFSGVLATLPVKPGDQHFWKAVVCGIKPQVTQHIVVYYQRGLPEKRNEPWFLATDLVGTPGQLVKLYAKRMGIEECFRDTKNVNNGWGLRHMRLTNAANLDRLLLILALAYLILCGLGLYALGHLTPRRWCANNRPGECGVFTIARRMLGLLEITLEQAFLEIGLCTKALAPKWG